MRASKRPCPPGLSSIRSLATSIFPEERVDSQIKDITEITQRLGVEAVKAAGGVSANEILKLAQQPSANPYWKLRPKGACQDIFYLTLREKLEGQIAAIADLAEKAGYAASNVGVYIQPIVQGTSYHCEFNLFYDPANGQGAQSSPGAGRLGHPEPDGQGGVLLEALRGKCKDDSESGCSHRRGPAHVQEDL